MSTLSLQNNWLKLVFLLISIDATSGHPSPPLELTRRNHDLSKRALPKRTATYIGVVVGIVGTAFVVTAYICWDLNRRRRHSRQRQMEEERYPRPPMSYDHFPVEPGDEVPVISRPAPVMATSSRPITIPPPPEGLVYEYGQDVVLGPPTTTKHRGSMSPPPGLETAVQRPSANVPSPSSSRPPTASAPPAYTPPGSEDHLTAGSIPVPLPSHQP